MTHIEHVTKYTTYFVDELARSGLKEVVLSPGSRSTPLAMTVQEHEQMNTWTVIDERSAAFFALGMAKRMNYPVALVCTSGTAAANYYPAIIEAYYSRVPLVVLTTDRPHELRDVGAPQAIEQIKMYGNYVKWFHEMALPESNQKMLQYARSKAARAVYTAQTGNPGPVHLNFPFREPLVPDFTLDDLWHHDKHTKTSYMPVVEGRKTLSNRQMNKLITFLKNHKKGLIVCGPQTDRKLISPLIQFARKWKLPILADPLSQLRAGSHRKAELIEGYDAILRNQQIRKFLKPDFILRFGAMPVSKMYLFYVQEHCNVPQFIIEPNEGYRDPTNQSTTYFYTDPEQFCEDMIAKDIEQNNDDHWLKTWQQMNQIVKKHIHVESEEKITEGEAIRAVNKVIPHDSTLFIGNSMAIRDVDTFFMNTDKRIDMLANRGANGIDGVTSTALGVATKTERVTLVIGDLSFYHDLNGLLIAKHYGLNVTIILINNNGGGIFSFLPQANDPTHFEDLFGTPTNIDYQHAVRMYGGNYEIVTHEDDLINVMQHMYQQDGLSVIEIQTDRSENVLWHQKIWQHIETELTKTFLKDGNIHDL